MIQANLVLDFTLKIKSISLTLSSLVIFVQIVLICYLSAYSIWQTEAIANGLMVIAVHNISEFFE